MTWKSVKLHTMSNYVLGVTVIITPYPMCEL